MSGFKGTTQEVVDFYAAQEAVPIPGVPKLDPRRVVDGQRAIEFLKPLPTSSEGKSFELRSKVVGVYDKGKPGTVVETQTELVSDGEVYTRVIGSGFFVGQGGWGGPKGKCSPFQCYRTIQILASAEALVYTNCITRNIQARQQ